MTEPHEVYPGGGTGPPPDEDELLRLADKAAELDVDDPACPDPAHYGPDPLTSDPADTQPGQGEGDPGELPADIPDAPGQLPEPEET